VLRAAGRKPRNCRRALVPTSIPFRPPRSAGVPITARRSDARKSRPGHAAHARVRHHRRRCFLDSAAIALRQTCVAVCCGKTGARGHGAGPACRTWTPKYRHRSRPGEFLARPADDFFERRYAEPKTPVRQDVILPGLSPARRHPALPGRPVRLSRVDPLVGPAVRGGLAWHALAVRRRVAFPGTGLLRLSMDLATARRRAVGVGAGGARPVRPPSVLTDGRRSAAPQSPHRSGAFSINHPLKEVSSMSVLDLQAWRAAAERVVAVRQQRQRPQLPQQPERTLCGGQRSQRADLP